MPFRLQRIAAVALAALIGALPAGAAAQEPPSEGGAPQAPGATPTPVAATVGAEQVVDALVAEALANNPDLLGAAESVAAAQARPEQARALPDPSVSVQYTNDGWSPTLGAMPMTTLAFMGSQTLPWPGKRGLRAAVAESDTAQARQQLERARLTLAAAVKRAFWGLALARETLGLLSEQRAIWQSAEAVVRGRYVVGQGAQQDVLRAQVEITRYEQLRAAQEAEVEVRAAELNRLLDRPAEAAAPQTPPLVLRAASAERQALWAEAESRSPELRAAAISGEREALAARLARKDFKPDVTLQAGYMNRGGLDPMWQAGVGVNLPAFRGRRRAAVAEAEARGRGRGAPGRVGARAAALPHAGESGAAEGGRDARAAVRRRRRAAGPARVRGIARQLPGRQGAVPRGTRGAVEPLRRSRRSAARRRVARADQGRARGGEPRRDERAAGGFGRRDGFARRRLRGDADGGPRRAPGGRAGSRRHGLDGPVKETDR